jgi:hypothetical protein
MHHNYHLRKQNHNNSRRLKKCPMAVGCGVFFVFLALELLAASNPIGGR